MRLGLHSGTHTTNKYSQWLSRISLALFTGSKLCSAIPGINFNVDDPVSIKAAASNVAYNLMSFYTGNRTGDVPGNLPQPYYWWEAGAMFGSMIDYYHYTNDTTYNDEVIQGMLWQVGPDNDYMTPNQTKTTGNDDQGFWALSAMSAAEHNFPNPPADKPQWLALAQAVFNTQAARWDTQYCNGGLRWQVFTFNQGFDYKNTISNGVYFNLAARLAVYTKNDTYAQWAEKTWDWTVAMEFMDSNYHFYDGAHTTFNCTDINKLQWTYNAGTYLMGAAAMYNYTNGADVWKTRILGILNGTSIFFPPPANNIMSEVICEPNNKCDTDNFSFKAYLSRWMAASTKFAPFTYDLVMPKLRASAIAAVQQCSGGSNGQMCGMKWTQNATWDGSVGVGQQMGALEVIQSNLIDHVSTPVTNTTGGTSKGNPAAGGSYSTNPGNSRTPVLARDRAGAGLLTALVAVSVVGGVWWMVNE